ncbi:pyridoxal phosphate-dependent decarboxylase family protein [Chromohalobacter israelensis]|uniref:Pyridoxal-dependent decarboxylase n=1 Tax=Chromohalobacter israelensis (strain ATCC BAA-138 / DSM 3043 / CIP 106854 / NCIMB 13768 / 1H11) TaxID=290398 RepID=Q1QZK7_CHRI1|nr:pyridoxal-dependent decarboxylase [Chromohalobacter salexigens]ABE58101.1 Pyridoxal-dependent decarboxylase [Chromohalobacter salexigens DSM 3043]
MIQMPRYPSDGDIGAQLVRALADEVANFMRPVSGPTHSALGEEAIRDLLVAEIPRRSLGPNSIESFVTEIFSKHIRSYRHPLHFGHQRPAPNAASLIADMLNGATNTTVSVFEAGPISVALEKHVQSWLLGLFNMPVHSCVTFTNGGSESVLTALLSARIRFERDNPDLDIRTTRIFVGSDAHYSAERAIRILGLSPTNVIRVPVMPDGQTSASALRKLVSAVKAEGVPILAIVATSGSTACGAFDDLTAFRQIADTCGAWLHVDACHGGACRLVPELARYIRGLEHADSFSWDPHKMMWVSPPCACLFMRRRRDLNLALADDLERASYILDGITDRPSETASESLEWTLSCTRSFSALKVYLTLILYGLDGIAERIRSMHDLACKLAAAVAADHRFKLFANPAFNIVCFQHRNVGSDVSAGHRQLRLNLAVADKCYLTGAEIHGEYWLRAQFTSEATRESDISKLLDIVDAEASHIRASDTPLKISGV